MGLFCFPPHSSLLGTQKCHYFHYHVYVRVAYCSIPTKAFRSSPKEGNDTNTPAPEEGTGNATKGQDPKNFTVSATTSNDNEQRMAPLLLWSIRVRNLTQIRYI